MRFERMTYRLEGGCSIQLSYRGIFLNYLIFICLSWIELAVSYLPATGLSTFALSLVLPLASSRATEAFFKLFDFHCSQTQPACEITITHQKICAIFFYCIVFLIFDFVDSICLIFFSIALTVFAVAFLSAFTC